MNALKIAALHVVAASLLGIVGCHGKPQTFASKVRIEGLEVVHRDEKGAPISVDVDFLWSECPGTQRQTVRNGAKFASCITKHKAGETVDAKVFWEWDEHGHYDWHVLELAGCEAEHVDDDDSSFDSVKECEPSKQHGAVVGIHCDKVPEANSELVKKCPWFKQL